MSTGTQGEPPRAAPSPEELRFAEDVATFFQDEGLPRITGRVIGWLLICDPPEQSPARLAEVLRVSRSSISTAMRMLTPSGLVERVGNPGDRQDYFRIDPDAWSLMLRRRAERMSAFQDLAARGLGLIESAPPDRRERLANVHELYGYLTAEIPAVFDRWAARAPRRRAT